MKKLLLLIPLISIMILGNAQNPANYEGNGTRLLPYKIKNVQDLDNLRLYVGVEYSTTYFLLINNLDLQSVDNDGKGWEPIGTCGGDNNKFHGIFDGNGKSITNLWINRPRKEAVGLFGTLGSNCTIRNLNVKSNDIIGEQSVGILVGETMGSNVLIEFCNVETNSYVDGKYRDAGAFIGYCDGDINIRNCTAKGSVKGGGRIGGFVGFTFAGQGNISNCSFEGLVNEISSMHEGAVGGFIGVNSSNYTIESCSSHADVIVETTATSVGGFVGYNSGRILNNYCIGNIRGMGNTGGFLGQAGLGSVISNNYCVGNVQNSSGNIGAFASVLDNSITINNCYYNKDVSGVQNSIGNMPNSSQRGLQGKTTFEMKIMSTYLNWDFSSVWKIKNKCSYPYFLWQPEPEESCDVFPVLTETFKPGPSLGQDACIFQLNRDCKPLYSNFPDDPYYQYNYKETPANVNYADLPLISAEGWTWGYNGCSGGGTVRSLLKFNQLDAIPDDALIVDVKLKLYGIGQLSTHPNEEGYNMLNCSNNSYPGSPYSASNTIYIQRVTGGWDENTVTWNTQPTATTANQISVGASNSQFYWNYVDSSDNLKSMIQYMVSHPDENYGFMFKLQTESHYRAMAFASSNNPDSSLWPELTVSYVLPRYDGLGTQENPYKIYTAADLDKLRYFTGEKYKNVYFELRNNIDLADYINQNYGSEGWEPIGDSINPFKGNFNGNFLAITNLTIDRQNQDNIGLFGVLENAEISRVALINKSFGYNCNIPIRGNNNVGMLAGKVIGGKILGCFVFSTCFIAGNQNVGGLVGNSSAEVINECSSRVIVYGELAGGLIGKQQSGLVISNYSQNILIPTQEYTCLGGLIGEMQGGELRIAYTASIPHSTDAMAIVGNLRAVQYSDCMYNDQLLSPYGIRSQIGSYISEIGLRSPDGIASYTGISLYNYHNAYTFDPNYPPGCLPYQTDYEYGSGWTGIVGFSYPFFFHESPYMNMMYCFQLWLEMDDIFYNYDFPCFGEFDAPQDFLFAPKSTDGEVTLSILESNEKNSEIKIYPNPTTGIVTIETNSFTTIKVYDIKGTLIVETADNKIDLSDYPSGIYIFNINGKIEKIIKQ